MITKVKNIVSWTFVLNGFNGKETVGTFYTKELQKANQKKNSNWKSIMGSLPIIKKGNSICKLEKSIIICLTVGLIKKT